MIPKQLELNFNVEQKKKLNDVFLTATNVINFDLARSKLKIADKVEKSPPPDLKKIIHDLISKYK